MYRGIGILVFILIPGLHAESLVLDPAQVCQWMSDDRFRGGSRYTQSRNLYRCNTNRKPITRGDPPKSDVRFVAEGSENAITQVRLEMQMRSSRHPQQALARFREYANSLTKRALSVELPEEIGKSLMSGTIGEWPVAGRTVTLKRVQDRGSSYDFHFGIRF